MNDTNEPITIGRRVRVVDGGVPQYGQFGLVLAPCTEASWYVRLDAAMDEQTFFQTEELTLATPYRGNRAHGPSAPKPVTPAPEGTLA